MAWTRRAAATLLALSLPRAARAHSQLLASTPAEGAVLAAAPAEVTLRFNEAVQLTALRLFAGDGAELPLRRTRDLAPRAEHRAALPRDLAPGAWRLVWRAISADGHEIGGTLRFRLEPPG